MELVVVPSEQRHDRFEFGLDEEIDLDLRRELSGKRLEELRRRDNRR